MCRCQAHPHRHNLLSHHPQPGHVEREYCARILASDYHWSEELAFGKLDEFTGGLRNRTRKYWLNNLISAFCCVSESEKKIPTISVTLRPPAPLRLQTSNIPLTRLPEIFVHLIKRTNSTDGHPSIHRSLSFRKCGKDSAQPASITSEGKALLLGQKL